MSAQTIMLVIFMVGLVSINVAAFKYVGIWGFFVTAACVPFAEKILTMIEKL